MRRMRRRRRSLTRATVGGPKHKTSHNMTHITITSQNKSTYPATRLPNKLSGTQNVSISSARLFSRARFTSFPVSLLQNQKMWPYETNIFSSPAGRFSQNPVSMLRNWRQSQRRHVYFVSCSQLITTWRSGEKIRRESNKLPTPTIGY